MLGACALADHDLRLRRGYDGANYLILNIEKLSKVAVKPISPNVRTSSSFDQLRGNPHAVPHTPYTALDDIPNAQFFSDLFYIHRAAFIGEGGVSCDDEESVYPRQLCDDVLRHAVSKKLLLGIGAHIRERQHRNRRLVRQG